MFDHTFECGGRRYGLAYVIEHGYRGEVVSLERLLERARVLGANVGSELAMELLKEGGSSLPRGLKLVFPADCHRFGFPIPAMRVAVIEDESKRPHDPPLLKLRGHAVAMGFDQRHRFVVPLR